MICIIEMLGFKLHANYCASSVKLEKKNVMEGAVTSAERVGGFLIPNFSGGKLGFFF